MIWPSCKDTGLQGLLIDLLKKRRALQTAVASQDQTHNGEMY